MTKSSTFPNWPASRQQVSLSDSDHLVTKSNQVYVTIMGGDGSLAQTIKELRKNEVINKHINKIVFCLLPYGTGNDTGQVFGWGSKSDIIKDIRPAWKVGCRPRDSHELPAASP